MERIIIKEFAGLKDFSSNLVPVMAFVGKNNQIKKALAKLIALFRNWEFQGKLLDYQSLLARFSIQNLLSEKTKIEYESDLRKIVFNGKYFEAISMISKVDENIRSEEIFKKQVLEIVQEALNEGGRSNKPEYLHSKLSEINVNIDSMVVVPAQRAMVAVFSDAFSMLKGANLPLPNDMLDFVKRFNQARETLHECELTKRGVKYEYNENEDRIIMNNSINKFSDASPVIQSILPLKLVLTYYNILSNKLQKKRIENLNKFSFLVEEPELHLHKGDYSYVIDLIIDKCDLDANNLIITTNQIEIAQLIKEKTIGAKVFDFQ